MSTENGNARERTARGGRARPQQSTGAGAAQAALRSPRAAGRARADVGKAARQTRATGMRGSVTLTLALVAVAVVTVIGVVVARDDEPTTAAAAALVRPASHRLSTAADGRTTVVEFLDFECAPCLAAYHGVEKLRAEYGNRITYVVRHFPIRTHPNGHHAAHAAEAAARQGRFEAMYRKLFDTQDAWGGRPQSQAAVFETYAREMGLDMAAYRADVTSAEVAAQVTADAADGRTAGVQGTPTFFINGTRYAEAPTYAGLRAAVDRSLAS
ncbi:MAG TPA: thioredoxin domain-containing protein [Pilimelia sp.]|nr:thioredoxin domain-containing protein [Pilimelia sp.]